MKKWLLFILTGCLLSGCSLFRIHKQAIEQGNLFNQTTLSQLHTGMSEAQVKNIMGNPVATNIFSDYRLEYVYTYQPGYGEMTEKRVLCLFENGRLQDIVF